MEDDEEENGFQKEYVVELEEGEADPTFKQQPRRKPKLPKPVEQPTLKSQGAQMIDKLSRGTLLLKWLFFLSSPLVPFTALVAPR